MALTHELGQGGPAAPVNCMHATRQYPCCMISKSDVVYPNTHQHGLPLDATGGDVKRTFFSPATSTST